LSPLLSALITRAHLCACQVWGVRMVCTPMPPEPAMSLKSPRSPRIEAAMKVLGILPKDIEPRARDIFPEGQEGEIRMEAFEVKRRQLMHSVTGMACDNTHDLAKEASAGGGQDERTAAFLADVMMREQASIDKMRKRAKADVQKIVLEEMAQKEQVSIREAKLAEHRQRMVVLAKAQAEKIKADKKEAAKKLEKSIEVRAKNDRLQEKASADLFAEVQKKDERVTAQLKERDLGWAENLITKQVEREANYERITKFKSTGWGVREKMYEGTVKRTDAATVRLGEVMAAQAAHQAAKSDLTAGVIAAAREQLGLEQGVKDTAYLERLKVHEKKKEIRETFAKAAEKEYAASNKKARANFEKNYERALKEREVVLVSPRMTKSMSESYTTNPAWRTEDSIKAFVTHHTMGELRQLNLQTAGRAHVFQQQQALHKIEGMRHRVDMLRSGREQTQFRRYDMIKNCAIEKHHLTFQVEKVRDAPAEKMNHLLEQMGMQPVKLGGAGGGDEGGEDEKKGF